LAPHENAPAKTERRMKQDLRVAKDERLRHKKPIQNRVWRCKTYATSNILLPLNGRNTTTPEEQANGSYCRRVQPTGHERV
jgi:hypothetical protein